MPFTHPPELRRRAVELVRSGQRPVDVAAGLGVSWTAVYDWLHRSAPELVGARYRECFRCRPRAGPPPDGEAYGYLLGLYLGDGWLHVDQARTSSLRIYCADAWPGLMDAAEEAMRSVSGRAVCRVRRTGCHELKSYWNHWPCVLPQHGPGKKHLRRIALEPWQREVVTARPGALLRGLFHSDGWRGTNVAVITRGGVTRRYEYPRYEFTNRSDDIRALCGDALDLLGIPWRVTGAYRLAVSRRDAVAALDEHVGPKH